MPFKANADRRHRIPKQRRRITNWTEYDAALHQRGRSLIWLMKGKLRRECLNCYMRRYRLIPETASIPATINVIGNHILTSAMLKNAKEAMIKITPTATVKIPNCLGINHLKRKGARTMRL